MKLQKLMLIIAFGLSSSLGTASAAVVDGTVLFNPSDSVVNQGASFFLDINASGFTSSLDGGSFNFLFDPAIVRVDNVVVDPTIWDFGVTNGTTNNTTGSVSGVEFNTFLNNPIGDFHIATVTFTALGLGVSPLILSEGANPYGSGGTPLTVGFQSGSITVVPLPPSLWVMGFSLVGLGLFGPRKARG